MTDRQQTFQEPPSDHFAQEVDPYCEWLWCGSHETAQDAIDGAAQDERDGPLSVKRVRANIEMTDDGPWLTLDDNGEWDFWQVRYVA